MQLGLLIAKFGHIHVLGRQTLRPVRGPLNPSLIVQLNLDHTQSEIRFVATRSEGEEAHIPPFRMMVFFFALCRYGLHERL